MHQPTTSLKTMLFTFGLLFLNQAAGADPMVQLQNVTSDDGGFADGTFQLNISNYRCAASRLDAFGY